MSVGGAYWCLILLSVSLSPARVLRQRASASLFRARQVVGRRPPTHSVPSCAKYNRHRRASTRRGCCSVVRPGQRTLPTGVSTQNFVDCCCWMRPRSSGRKGGQFADLSAFPRVVLFSSPNSGGDWQRASDRVVAQASSGSGRRLDWTGLKHSDRRHCYYWLS